MCLACHSLLRQTKVLCEQNPGFRRFRKNAKSDYERRHVCLSVYPSAWNNAAHNGQIFMQFEYFPKIFREFSRFIKIRQEFLIIYMKPNTNFWPFHFQLLL
jgi:hypothetical protein